MAADTPEAVLLVAKPDLDNPIYKSSVIIARRTPNGGYVGFIVNKPTTAVLSEIFPQSAALKKAADRLFLGGPASANAIFALVERHDGAKDGAIRISPDLFLAVRQQDVDGIIESEAGHARFFAGLIVWKPGELDDELTQDAWYVLEPDAKLVLRKNTAGLWEELVLRSEERARAI
jgi:putative transcriptional regulator